MSERAAKPQKSLTAFWWACRYLRPHSAAVITSFLCAILVGGAMAGGLSTMLPIIRVLFSGDTVQAWVNRQIVETRMGVRLAEEAKQFAIVRIDRGRKSPLPAEAAGLQLGTVGPASIPGVDALLAELADPARSQATLTVANNAPVTVQLSPVPWYLKAGRQLVAGLPDREHPVKAVAVVFGLLAAVACLGNLGKFVQEYMTSRIAILAANDIRRHLYDHLLHVPMSVISRSGSSDFTSRLTQDTLQLQEGFKTLLGTTVQEPILATIALIAALVLDWRLTCIILVFAPVMAIMIRILGKKMHRLSRKNLQASASMLGQIEATLQGLRVVKGSNAEPWERRRYMSIMDKLVRQAVKMARIDAFSTPALETLTIMVGGCIVMAAAYLVMVAQPHMSPGTFLAIMVCLMMIAESGRKCAKVSTMLHKASAAAERASEVLHLPVERPRSFESMEDRPRIKLRPIEREVRFENITFAYPGSPTPALRDVSLTVKKGTSVAVVGRNGSGKTTLLALLPRFYDAQAGRILIDDIDIRDVTLKSLRSQISIVTQDSVIFPGTILENIAYGARNPSREAVIEAAKRAYAHDFIMLKPLGYETMLGELGGQLSGGQRQRICIARAIYRQSPILILDEATSQVDAESEELIQQAIEQVMRGRTTFVIAHRWHTIRSADTVVVIEKGQVVGQGLHDDLIKTCEVYQQLYERQIASPVA